MTALPESAIAGAPAGRAAGHDGLVPSVCIMCYNWTSLGGGALARAASTVRDSAAASPRTCSRRPSTGSTTCRVAFRSRACRSDGSTGEWWTCR